MMGVRAGEKVVHDTVAKILEARRLGVPEPHARAEPSSELGLPADLLHEDAPVVVLAVQSRENFEAEWAGAAANPTPPMSRVRTIDGAQCRTLVDLGAELQRAYSDSLDASKGEWITPHWSSIDEYIPMVLDDKEGFEVLAIINGSQILADEPTQLFHFVFTMRYIALESRKFGGSRTPPGPCLRTVVHIPPESIDAVARFLLAGMGDLCPSIRLSQTDIAVDAGQTGTPGE